MVNIFRVKGVFKFLTQMLTWELESLDIIIIIIIISTTIKVAGTHKSAGISMCFASTELLFGCMTTVTWSLKSCLLKTLNLKWVHFSFCNTIVIKW